MGRRILISGDEYRTTSTLLTPDVPDPSIPKVSVESAGEGRETGK